MNLLICIILITPILWLLFAPMVLKIDTQQQLYYVRWVGIGSCRVKVMQDDLVLTLQLLFWKKEMDPIEVLVQQQKAQSSKKKKKKRSSRSIKKWKRLGLRLMKSFTVKQFRLRLDTDDYVLNSYLFPVSRFLNFGPHQVSINYLGESSLQLQIENRLIRLLRAVLL